MKRQIFIVDDKIEDAEGFLLVLYATLSDCFDDEKEMKAIFDEVELFYIDILWEGEEQQEKERKKKARERKKFFTESYKNVKQYVKKTGVPLFSSVTYLDIFLSKKDYDNPATRKNLANQVYDAIGKKRQESPTYVILLDIILNVNKDTGEILEKKDVLSSILIREKIDEKHCIVYSTYDSFVFDDWKALAGRTPNCVRREWICRGRAIDLKYQQGLIDALELATNDGGSCADG